MATPPCRASRLRSAIICVCIARRWWFRIAQPSPRRQTRSMSSSELRQLLAEHLEGAQDVEIEEVESFTQELQTMAPFTGNAEEEGKVKAYAMTNPPAMLTSQLS
eukprot:4895988-Prymnesium_polylepis.1